MHASNLSDVVLALSGFEQREDELFDWYFKRLDYYAHENLNTDLDLHELAFNFYIDIMHHVRSQNN
jgi:hypothetical protein